MTLILVLTVFGAAAQAETTFKTPDKKFLIKPFLEIPGLQLEFKSATDPSKLVSWVPNYRTQTGVTLAYGGLFAVSVAGKGDVKQEDQALKGDTSYSDFRFRFPWRRVSVELGYQKTRGFYADNTSSFDSSAGGTYLKRPDLTLESTYLQMVAVLSPDQYSIASVFDQSEKQEGDGGSLLATLQYVATSFADTQALIPTQLQGSFGAESQVTRGIFHSLNLGIGYGYIFRFGETGYLFGQLLGGLGAQVGKTSSPSQEFSATDSSSLIRLDAGVGTNGQDWVTGLLFSVDSASNKTAAMELSRRLLLLHIFVGMRF